MLVENSIKEITTIAAIISAVATTGLTLSIVQMPQAQGAGNCDILFPKSSEQFVLGCEFGYTECSQHKPYDSGKTSTQEFKLGYHEGWIKRGCK